MRTRIMRVSRSTGLETERVNAILVDGSITRNQDTRVTETASLTLEGDADFGADLLRIWADVTYTDGTRESIPLGTFLPDGAKREIDGGEAVTIPLNLYGRLRELDDDQFQYPVMLETGTNPMDWIETVIHEAGLEIAPHAECVYRLGAPWTFGTGESRDESKLSAINDLLALAGWNSARTDPYGRVLLTPYEPPDRRAPSWDFTEGANARFLRSMTDERDWFDTANQVRVVYSTQERDVIGIAVDDDPASAFSTVTRGRVIGKTYTYSDIPDGLADADLQKMADAKALELLATTQSVIRRVVFTHIWAPVGLGDVVNLQYPTGKVDGRFAVRTQKITLTGGLPIEAEARSFERSTVHEQ
ncbi:MAG: hypothetical protein UHD09_02405 [Bifidobacterium sp.]|nr:hypothetical protein [Bifidobacterium sp.]